MISGSAGLVAAAAAASSPRCPPCTQGAATTPPRTQGTLEPSNPTARGRGPCGVGEGG